MDKGQSSRYIVAMEDTIQNILEKIEFSKKESFGKLLEKTLGIAHKDTKSTYAIHENVVFRVNELFKGFSSYINEFGKDKKYEAGVHALKTICDEIAVEIEKEECFILFHLRDLGKFRKKESDLFKELSDLWHNYPDYRMEKTDLTYALKNLMRMKFITYRRGNLYLNQNIIVRYRTGR
jgi:hypothetical protein